MADKEPTQEQVKEFWEWVKPVDIDPYGHNRFDYYSYPPINLNNLFKYAVPKLGNIYIGFDLRKDVWTCEIKDVLLYDIDSQSQDPALALFWAIYELIKK